MLVRTRTMPGRFPSLTAVFVVQAAQILGTPLAWVLIADHNALQATAFHGMAVPHNLVRACYPTTRADSHADAPPMH